LYFQAELIREYFGDGSRFGVDFNYVMAGADLGTAGSVKNAQSILDERFIIISGDVATDINLSEAVQFHKARKAEATIVLTVSKIRWRTGLLLLTNKGKSPDFWKNHRGVRYFRIPSTPVFIF
jgi:mannose-1-phosphate guanylyltransferase/phosphomannomutase